MYPEGFATKIEVRGPAVGLETECRPHFFGGVATVVSKLLIAAMPDYAIFGEKDYQQLLVIRRMVTDLRLPIDIAGGDIAREADGLAMSSRNAYLSPEQRQIAGQLNQILKSAAERIRGGKDIPTAITTARNAILKSGFDTVDYVAVRDAGTLAKIADIAKPARILAAAKIGNTRLIDNMAV
jgi:pantoate--beta-alanine ligase